jgi:hypothetical protein
MSKSYIENHFSDIKGYACVIENRLIDEDCTPESVASDNEWILSQAEKHDLPYILIDESYEFDVNL